MATSQHANGANDGLPTYTASNGANGTAPTQANGSIPAQTDNAGPTKPETFPSSGINIIIAGGGIAGLMFAIEAQRNGHACTVLESRPGLDATGDWISIGPSALRGIERNCPDLFDEMERHCMMLGRGVDYHSWKGEYITNIKPKPTQYGFGTQIGRYKLARIMINELNRRGIPLRFGAKAVKFSEDDKQGYVEIANGEKFAADLILAADGIHSRSWEVVHGLPDEPIPSGLAIYRASYPTEIGLQHPLVRERFGKIEHKMDQLKFFLGKSFHAIAVVTPQTLNWVLIHKDDGKASESWSNKLSAEEAVERITAEAPDWDPAFLALVGQTPANTIVDWRLMWRNPHPKWVSDKGRICQIGDCGHAFLPTSVNGGTQAVEDAFTLPTILRLAGKENIPPACKICNILRYERTSCVQLTGFGRNEALWNMDWEMLKTNPAKATMRPPGWMTAHDPEKYALERYEECRKMVEEGREKEFKNGNTPPGMEYEDWDIRDVKEKGLGAAKIWGSGNWFD